MTDEELLRKLEDTTCHASRHQEEALHSILERHSGAHYLRGLLAGCPAPIDAATFRRVVPLSTYDDYSDHINCLADGTQTQPLLSTDPLVCFFSSSGTSSTKPKMIPYFDSSLSKAASRMAHRGSSAILKKLFPPRTSANSKIMLFVYAGNLTSTRGGFEVMPASSYPLRRSATWSKSSSCSSPVEVFLGSNVTNQMYCHLLCGLCNSEFIDGIHAPYAIGLIQAFSLLESKWSQLCDDLENGFLGEEISDPAMRSSVTELLGGPRADLSMRARTIFQQNSWDGIVPKLWPNIRYVKCVATGSMKQYYPKLKRYVGETPLLGADYLASECCVAVNLDPAQPPETTRFVMLPTAAYFEFLPCDPVGAIHGVTAREETTVDFSGVEVGKTYELVVTTHRGLYRYRLGDIVRVAGFHNCSPRVEFVMRAPQLGSDTVTEADLMSAIESCQLVMRAAMGIEIAEFAATFLGSEPITKQLKILAEVTEDRMFVGKKMNESILVLRRICSLLEDNLGSLYRARKERCEGGSLLLTIVKPGSFDKLSRLAIENGASASQYKPPKILRKHELVSFLELHSLVSVSLDNIENSTCNIK